MTRLDHETHRHVTGVTLHSAGSQGTATTSLYSTVRTKCKQTTFVFILTLKRECTMCPTRWRPAGTPLSRVHCLSTSSPVRKWSWSCQSVQMSPCGMKSSLQCPHVSRELPSTWAVSSLFLCSSLCSPFSKSHISSCDHLLRGMTSIALLLFLVTASLWEDGVNYHETY